MRASSASLAFVTSFVLLAACVKKDPPAAEEAAAAQAPAPPLPEIDAAKEARSRDAALSPLETPQKTKLLAELKAGRTLAKAEKWAEAKAAFERALVIDPGNAAVLSELSWVFVNVPEYDAAIESGTLALRSAYDAKTRAAILYNLGRAYEGKGDPMEAAVRYRQSLEKRPNATVQKRLDDLVAKAKKDILAEKKKEVPPVVCGRRFSEDLALFQCLERVTDDGFAATPIVSAFDAPAGLVPPMRLAHYGNEAAGLTAYLLVRTTSQGAIEPIAELARAWNPGAFGVHEEYTYTASKETVYGKRHVVEVYGRHSHTDADYGGLSVANVTTEQATVCAYEGDEAATCLAPLVLSVTETQTYPMDPKGLSAEDNALLAVLRKDKPPSTQSARAELSTTTNEVTVTRVSGPQELLPSLGKHPIK